MATPVKRMLPMYSVVMAVYKNDNPVWFKLALDSMLLQTVPSDDIVIVIDGWLPVELEAVLNEYKKHKIISFVRLELNQGLGNALNVGIEKARNELIARMDADDISVANRIELQLAEFLKKPDLEILGGQIAEFTNNPDDIVSYRKVPTTKLQIKEFARRRSPFNHPTVMYKKATIQSLGGYDMSAIRIEDYDLWLRAISADVSCANIDDVVLRYRSTQDAMKRRKTLASLKSHLKARARFYSRQYITLPDFAYGVVTQIALFVLPTSMADKVFKKVVRGE